jgi:hypothetical protein
LTVRFLGKTCSISRTAFLSTHYSWGQRRLWIVNWFPWRPCWTRTSLVGRTEKSTRLIIAMISSN